MMVQLVCMAIALAAPPSAFSAEIDVPRLSGPVALDGRLEEPMWRRAARLPYTAFSRWVANTYRPDPPAFTVRFFHDGTMLYVALTSYDPYVESGMPPETSDGLYAFSLTTSSGRLERYRLLWEANPPVPHFDMYDTGLWGARLRGPFDDPAHPGGGYVFEFAIRLSAVGWKPGDTIPVNIIVNDHNGKPRAPFRAAGVEFARFAWGAFDDGDVAHFAALKLAP